MAVKIFDQGVGDTPAPWADVGDAHHREVVKEMIHEHFNTLRVLNASLDGTLRVIERSTRRHAGVGKDRLCHAPNSCRQRITPKEKTTWFQHADNLVEDGNFLRANRFLSDVCLRNDNYVDGLVQHWSFTATAPSYAARYELTLQPRIVPRMQVVASVNRSLLHVHSGVI